MWKTLLILSLALVLFLFGIGATLDDSWHVETERTIDAPPVRILAEAADLTRWQEWSTLQAAMGQNTKVSLGDVRTGVGATMVWKGAEGEATLRLVEADPRTGLRYEFSVTGVGVLGTGGMRFREEAGGTAVTWYDDGRLETLLQKWLWKLGVGLDEEIRKQQETSLANLKLRIEEKR